MILASPIHLLPSHPQLLDMLFNTGKDEENRKKFSFYGKQDEQENKYFL